MIGALLLLAAAAAPEEACGNLPQQPMNLCMFDVFERADAAMNAQWKETVQEMKEQDRELAENPDLRAGQPGYFETLLAGQRAWLIYREQQCLVESFAMRGGSGQPMVDSGCKLRLTRERTKQLKDLIETGN